MCKVVINIVLASSGLSVVFKMYVGVGGVLVLSGLHLSVIIALFSLHLPRLSLHFVFGGTSSISHNRLGSLSIDIDTLGL